MLSNRKGFTLIELLIVVVIIGILAAIAIPKFSATREKAYYSAMKSDLKNLQSQQEIYYQSDTDGAAGVDYIYAGDGDAETLAGLDFTASSGVTVTVSNSGNTGWAATATHEALTPAANHECAVMVQDAADPSTGAYLTGSGVVQCIGE